jgi:ABC-type nitrate/sulfonate/bicarbonate transport system permease component
MELDQITAIVTNFFQAHQLISIVALAVLAYFLYQSPKETCKFLMVVAVLAVAGYFIVQLGSSSDTGVSAKQELSQKTKKALGD